jgi:hypothetical protein
MTASTPPQSSIPELPFVDNIIEVATPDLEASRDLLQRLLTIQDTLLAAALTVAGTFAGLAFAYSRRSLALIAVPLIVVLWYLDGTYWVHFRRVSRRIRSLENLFRSYIESLRVVGDGPRQMSISRLRNQVDSYEYGVERSLKVPKLLDVWRSNCKRVRWWFYAAIAALLTGCGGYWVPNGTITLAQTFVTVVSSGNPSAIDTAVSYTATVAERRPGAARPGSGDVEFFDSGSPVAPCGGAVGEGVNASGTVTCTVTYRTTGRHVISAEYLGSIDFAASDPSTAIVQRVGSVAP